MRYLKTITILIALLSQAGCSTLSVNMYEGPEKPISELVTFRVYGPRIIVKMVDGKNVENFYNAGKVSKAYTLPGKKTFTLYTYKDAYWTGMTSGYKFAYSDIEVDTKAGHTYIFNVEFQDDIAIFSYQDKGKNYNPECLEPQAWGKVFMRKKLDVVGC